MAQPSAESLLSRSRGRSLKSITKQGIGAWLLTVSTSAILGFQAIVELFVLTPVEVLQKIIAQVATSLILEPLGVVETGAETSGEAITGLYLFGLPVSVLILLGSFAIISWYLVENETSDLFPGTFTDFIGGTEEEADDDQ